MLSNFIKSGVIRTAAILAAAFVVLAAGLANSDPAEAKRRNSYVATSGKSPSANRAKANKARYASARRARRAAPADDVSGNPLFSAIVVDVKSGLTLYQASADGLRHPASITKVMTLYMLFEQLQAGRLSLASELPVSAHAASQAPTKLGLRAGETISVEDAIDGIVTRSANDAAVVVAEALGGTESNFAAMMTRKARSLGMSRTVYLNASGLPDPGQITTARDLAILGIAVQDQYPRYYRYFQTRSFVFRGRGIANHNKLLGLVEGVDGIKTGYTRMSGFNLLTSVKRDNRQLVAVVLGGRSGSSRDATMRRLIEDWMPRAYAGNRRTGTLFASSAPAKVAPAAIPDPDPGTRDAVAFVNAPSPPPPAPPAQKVRPAVVAEAPRPKANAPVAAPIRLASTAANPILPLVPQPRPFEEARPAVASTIEGGPILRWVEGASPVTAPASAPARTAEATLGAAPADGSPVQLVKTTTFKIEESAEEQGAADTGSVENTQPEPARAVQAKAEAPQPATTNDRTGWIIQIGATDSEPAARKLLDKARSAGQRALGSAEPFTESVERNGSTLWRARFAGFNDQQQAKAACAALKSKDFACLAVRL